MPALMAATGLNEFDVRLIVSTAPIRYKTYSIPKRTGGERKISQPAREVKALQRVLVDTVLSRLPVHSAATAYQRGASIRNNAKIHAGGGAILKLDFSDFFPSIRAEDWQRYCEEKNVFESPEDIEISTRIFFTRAKNGTIYRLAIGAPSSPVLSNVIMYEFDRTISDIVAKDHVAYTRYADDLTFSAKRTGFLNGVEKNLGRLIKSTQSPRLKLNAEKRVVATRKFKRMVTGLILTNDGTVSLGQDRKRSIRVAVHHASQGKLSVKELAHLSGMLAFVKAVEPEYLDVLRKKYGSEILTIIRRAPKSLKPRTSVK